MNQKDSLSCECVSVAVVTSREVCLLTLTTNNLLEIWPQERGQWRLIVNCPFKITIKYCYKLKSRPCLTAVSLLVHASSAKQLLATNHLNVIKERFHQTPQEQNSPLPLTICQYT